MRAYSNNSAVNSVHFSESSIYNYYGFLRADSPISFTYGLTLGYILKQHSGKNAGRNGTHSAAGSIPTQ